MHYALWTMHYSYRYRQIAAHTLLAVFLSMMLMQASHVHHDVGHIDVCTDCLHHVNHDSHFSTASFSIDNCVLCQFAGIPFLFAVALSLVVFVRMERMGVPFGTANCLTLLFILHSPRAPPCALLPNVA